MESMRETAFFSLANLERVGGEKLSFGLRNRIGVSFFAANSL